MSIHGKTGLFQVADVTVGGPTGAGLSGGEVICYTSVYDSMQLHFTLEKAIIYSNAVTTYAQHTFS